MRLLRICASALIGLAVTEAIAQDETNLPARLPPATPATTNLLTTNLVTTTNLFGEAGAIPRGLGLMEAIQRALTNNYDIRIEAFGPQVARQDLEAAKGAYDPVLGVSAGRDHVKGRTGYSDTDSVNVGLSGNLPTGTIYRFGINASENLATPFATNRFRTGAGSATVIDVTQPLLRNLWIDPTRYAIAISRKQLQISELAFRAQLLSTVSRVEQAYFAWIAARENVRVQEEAVSLARQQAREYEIRTQIGVTKPLDVQQFEAQAARSEATLLTARRTLKETENTLVNLITAEYEAWRGLALEPLDTLPTVAQEFDLQSSWTRAFEHRPDLHDLIVRLEQLGLAEKLSYNQLFPTLNLRGIYGYDAFGDSFRGVFSDLSDGNKPFWSLGFEASIPIGNRSARANLKATRLQKDQATERLKQYRQNIMVDVENAIIAARTSWERIPATRAAREYAASALDAGQKRLAAGTATSLEILTLQRDLTAARSDEISALVDYNRAVTVLLEREGTLLDARGLSVTVQ